MPPLRDTVQQDQLERLTYYVRDSKYPLKCSCFNAPLPAVPEIRFHPTALRYRVGDSDEPLRYRCQITSLSAVLQNDFHSRSSSSKSSLKTRSHSFYEKANILPSRLSGQSRPTEGGRNHCSPNSIHIRSTSPSASRLLLEKQEVLNRYSHHF
jgi:hypothetical protein